MNRAQKTRTKCVDGWVAGVWVVGSEAVGAVYGIYMALRFSKVAFW